MAALGFKEVIIEIIYILFGWLLGLLSPTIINYIKQHYERKKFFTAAKLELTDLQFHLCLTGMLLAQRYGNLSRDYLVSIRLIVDKYNGEEKTEEVILLIDSILDANDEQYLVMIDHLRGEDGIGLSLKNHSTILIDSNAVQISQLPISLQSKIYEFKNALNIYNQNVSEIKTTFNRTFDSTLTDINHEQVVEDLKARYAHAQDVCTRVCCKIQGVIDYKL
jgi:flagellar biosynthesis regulator FlbT